MRAHHMPRRWTDFRPRARFFRESPAAAAVHGEVMSPAAARSLSIGPLARAAAAGGAGACARFAELEPDKVSSLSLRLAAGGGGGDDTVCANDPRATVIAVLVHRDGKRVESWTGEGSRRGRLRLGDLAVEAEPVTGSTGSGASGSRAIG